VSEFSRVRAPALVAALAGLACLGIALPSQAQTNISVVEIGPKQSSLDPSDPDGASGGRVNGLAIVPGDKSVIYAAAEWGGLFKSEDAGLTWNHLAGHTPHATWDIEVEPSDADVVYATSFYDGRIDSRAGIGVSRDGGLTWAKPPSATPPENFCTDPIAREEPAAFGVAADPDAEGMVYVGTNCGIAISTDAGVSWSFVDPSPGDGGADRVWDVVVHHGGAIDTCGEDGHRRSTDGGATWSTPTGINRLPAGICSIAASPDEGNVLFAVVGVTIFESVDGGGSWFNRYNNPRAQGRIPFVATNDRAGSGYDLWFGDVQLHRTSCTTPTTAGPGPRCQTTWTGPFTRSAGAHDDTGAILFDSEATVDACPVLMSSDGGV
jgi:hypothetical protein